MFAWSYTSMPQGDRLSRDGSTDSNAEAAARVTTALYRMREGNLSNVEGVGGGAFEYRIDFGPGYRIYFGKDGDTLIVLLGGSSKKRQQHAIQAAQESWKEYKRRKAHG